MKTMITIMMMFAVLTGATAFAAEKTKTQGKQDMQMTAEQRQNMAATHEKMANCLRSDKSMEVCRQEMMQSCKDMMGKDRCPMMGHMGKMHGMMGKGMMNQEQKKDEVEKK